MTEPWSPPGPPAALDLVGDAAVGEREDLEAARVGDQRPVPAHEPVQAAGARDPLRPGRDEQVVGVAEDQLVAEPGDLVRLEPAHRPLRRERDERRRLDRPVRRCAGRPARAAPSRASISKRSRSGSSIAIGCSLTRPISERPVIALGLRDAEELEHGRGDVGEDAAVAQLEPLGGDDQRHRVERVGGVGRAVGLEHVVAVAVVGGDDAGAAAASTAATTSPRQASTASTAARPRPGSPRCGRPCRGWRS